jgi:hypothetical protein
LIPTAATRIGTIQTNFDGIDPKYVEAIMIKTRRVFLVKYRLEVALGKAEGVLCFRVLIGGKEVGTANIDYSNTSA